jgi:hypothetical protein
VPHRSRCIRPLPSSTRACGVVWHLRLPSASLRGAAVRADAFRREMPGFFALAAETPTLRVARDPLSRSPEARGSLRPSAGGADEEAEPRARAVAPQIGMAVSGLPCVGCGARDSDLPDGVSARQTRPHAPSTGSTLGSMVGQTVLPDRHRGARSGLSASAHPEHPCREEDGCSTPSRSAVSSVARRLALVWPCGSPREGRQDASNSASTTDVSRHEHPSRLAPSETVRRAPWGNPPAFDLQILSARFTAPSATPDHLAVIRPPTAPRLTARGRLRAPRLPPSRSRAPAGIERRGLFSRRSLRRVHPLASLVGGAHAGRRSNPCHADRARSLRPHVNAADLPEPGMPSTGEDHGRPLARASAEPPFPLASESAAARVHRCSRTSTRPLAHPLSRARSRPHALLRLLQIHVSTSTTTDHSNITGRLGVRSGRLPGSIESPRSTAITDGARGQGPRNTAPRRSPWRLLAAGTSPQPRPFSGASCRGHRPFTLFGETWGESATAFVWRACRATPARGPCGARFPRRNPALTSPRHLPSRGRFARAKRRPPRASELARRTGRRLFHRPEPRAGDARTDPDSSATGAEAGVSQPCFD